MASRELVPSINKALPLATEKLAAAPVRTTPHTDGVHNYAPDHSLRPSHEVEHEAVRPLQPSTRMRPRGYKVAGERDGHFISSDETALSKQIQATHVPEIEGLDVRPVLSIVEDIFRLAMPLSDDHHTAGQVHGVALVPGHVDTSLDKVPHSTDLHTDKPVYETSYLESDIVGILAYPINKISNEIVCKCASGGEPHQVTMELLRALGNYSWDAKVVITLAAFAINYGEFWLVEHLHTKNPLARNIAALKDFPETMDGDIRKQFEAVLALLAVILKVTHCIIEFKELPSQYASHQSPEVMAATAHIPTGVYWIVRSLLVCAASLLNLVGSNHEYISSASASWEIRDMTHKLSVIMEHLQERMKICKDLIERKRSEDAYIAFKKLLETTHVDNMKVLRALFRHKEDQRPLYNGSTQTTERLEVLRLKYVLILISDLQLPQEELHVLHIINNEHSMRHEYEVLWLPVVDPASSTSSYHDPTFFNLRNNMPWYSVDHPSLIEPVVIRYIREDLHFTHMPMLVVLDTHGKLSTHDALPMMWIWGAEALPFTVERERFLWSKSDWNINLLVDAIDPRIPEWMHSNRVICLYGGDDINWVRKFTSSVRTVARAANVPLEMLYVAKRNPKEKVRHCHEMITRDNLSHVFPPEYYDYVWYFWVRLLSMWNSKRQSGRTAEEDHIMQGIINVLGFDSSEQGWAVFSRGNYEITMANSDKIQHVLDNYNEWIQEVDHPDKFVNVLDKHLRGYHPEHHCNRLILPGHTGQIPEMVVCSECGKTMDKYVMYRCCTD